MYNVISPYFTLNDKPIRSTSNEGRVDQHFTDLYQLFLVKVAKMPQEGAMSEQEEKRLIELFSKLNSLKRELEVG